MVYEPPIRLMGSRVRHLIAILNLGKATRFDCIVVFRNPFQCFSYERDENFKHEEYRLTKADIKHIKLIYEITGDLETSLYHLFKD